MIHEWNTIAVFNQECITKRAVIDVNLVIGCFNYVDD